MSLANPAIRNLGPAWIKTRNKVFYAQGNVQLIEQLNTFNVRTARAGTTEKREDSLTYLIRFTPVGKLDALSVCWPHGASKPGDLVHATAKVVSIALDTNIITFDSLARFRDGSPIRLETSAGDAPAGTTAGALRYLRKISSTTGTLHDTEAHALANTDIDDITDAGTGSHAIIEEEYLIIQPVDGSLPWQFHNTAVVEQPGLDLAGNRTPIGQVTFEAFRKFSTAPSNAASLYTRLGAAITDTSFDFADIDTEVFTIGWGAAAPWSGFYTRNGIQVAFALSLSPWGDAGNGITTRVITDLSCMARAIPHGLDEAAVLAKRAAQDAGAGRGRRIVSTDPLNIISSTADQLYIRLYGAILDDIGALNWDPVEERVDELTWMAQRVVTAGAPGDLFYVGASAPA